MLSDERISDETLNRYINGGMLSANFHVLEVALRELLARRERDAKVRQLIDALYLANVSYCPDCMDCAVRLALLSHEPEDKEECRAAIIAALDLEREAGAEGVAR